MKRYATIILALTLGIGCSSSDKKSASSNQETSTSQTEIESGKEDTTIISRLYTPGADTSGLIHFTGQLNYTGNEPFAVPALFVSGTKTVRLTGDSTFIHQTYKTINGKKATIYGEMKDMGIDSMLEVHYYELRESN
ncbi:hypothetical protein [Gracilimonas sp.]|uniref:hypothetical protein n=1 Tax=Gracilimonas sp. TaxID=1974203 RepID=UPI0032EF21EF